MRTAFKFFSIFILLSSQLFGQIANEIESYVDSTEILVKNGRKMMFKELNDNNIIKAKDIYNYLTKITDEEYYSAFYYIALASES